MPWCMDVPGGRISINTPYPGTETWLAGQHQLNTRDYRLFDGRAGRSIDDSTERFVDATRMTAPD